MGAGVGFQHDFECAQPALGVGDSPVQQVAKLLIRQRFKREHAGAGEQRRVDLKIGVFGGRADQHDGSVFHMRQQGILLGFVKSVNLVNKQHCLFAVHSPPQGRRFNDFS